MLYFLLCLTYFVNDVSIVEALYLCNPNVPQLVLQKALMFLNMKA